MTATRHKLEILYFTPYFGGTLLETGGFSPAVAEDLCTVTVDPGRITTADAVLFHIPSMKEPPRVAKKPGQLWVGLTMESNANYPLQSDPGFMRHFDIVMNFQKSADIHMVYFNAALVPELTTLPKWKFRRAPAVYLASNDHAHNNRHDLARELMQYLKVDSYGKSLNNRRIKHNPGRPAKLRIISRYLFYFAFENTNSTDYVTEKVYDGLVAGTVPVYLGAPNIDEYLPAGKCIIKAGDFRSAAELARYLLALTKDKAEYASYLSWKKEPLRQSFLDLLEPGRIPSLRRLCYKLKEMKDKKQS